MNCNILRRLRDCILQQGNLCGFYETAEAEAMIGQTIIASASRVDVGGEPYSVRGHSVARGLRRCGPDNASAYARLLTDGMFCEGTRADAVVIFPTPALLEKLSVYFLDKAANKDIARPVGDRR